MSSSKPPVESPKPAPPPPIPRLSIGRTARMALKELREILRDRRTIITLVLMPILVYPLLAVAFRRYLLTTPVEQSAKNDFVIGVKSELQQAKLSRYLRMADRVRQRKPAPGKKKAGKKGLREVVHQQTDSGQKESRPPSIHIEYRVVEDLAKAVREVEVDLGVIITDTGVIRTRLRTGQSIACKLLFRDNSLAAMQARSFVERRLHMINVDYVQARLARRGLGPRLPVVTSTQVIKGEIPFSLAALVPLILILMTSTGAVYPAIEVTAGERERGTLEALIAAPVPRLSLLLAKFVAVITVATITATVNVAAMLVTITVSGLAPFLFGPGGITFSMTGQVFGLLILFATFFSAVSLALTSFARSFKEAQAYLIPLMLISIAPGLFTLMPQMELTGQWMVMPLVNIVLLARDVCQSTASLLPAIVAVLTSGIYTLVAISIAARVFGSDALLYGSGGSWSELFQRPMESQKAPTVTAALSCLAVMFPAFFICSGIVATFGTSISNRLFLGSVVTALLFGAFPILVALYRRIRIFEGFSLRGSQLLNWIGAVIFGVSTWPFVHELIVTAHEFGVTPLGAAQFAVARKFIESWQDIHVAVILLTLAVVPAIFEELFFRGFLLNALRKRMNAGVAVLLAALFFGVFHVLSSSGAPERFLPSTFLGIILGWVCVRSRSVLPSMVMHGCNNGLLLMVIYYKDELVEGGWGIEEQTHLPIAWLMAAWLGVATAILVMLIGRKREGLANGELS